ncbi:MAG: hypothetical protein AAGF58_04715 [Pseudomonadota bacterium]
MYRSSVICLIIASIFILLSVATYGNVILAALGMAVLAGSMALEA